MLRLSLIHIYPNITEEVWNMATRDYMNAYGITQSQTTFVGCHSFPYLTAAYHVPNFFCDIRILGS